LKGRNYELGLTRKYGPVQAKVIAPKLLAYKEFLTDFQGWKSARFMPLIRARERPAWRGEKSRLRAPLIHTCALKAASRA
jgi:hypothetical protein